MAFEPMDFDKEVIEVLSRRLRPAYCVFMVLLFVVFVRVWDLQVLRGDYFFDLSENNRIKIQEILAPRGAIYDRTGSVIANTTPSFDVSCLEGASHAIQETAPLLGKILHLSPEAIASTLHESRYQPPFRPTKIKLDVSREELSLVEFHKLDLPEVTIEVFPKRNYLLGSSLAHVIGYLGKISETELRLQELANYNSDDFIGKSGIEKTFESQLRGRSGWLQFEVDALGRKKKVLTSTGPVPGNNLFLTIDNALQAVAEQSLGDKQGSVVAMDPHTGEVLAFVSHPSFDPNRFSRGISLDNWSSLRNDRNHPLTNKGIQGLYPPGSVFKVITAIAGLEEGKISPENTVFCTGSYWFGNRAYRCWKKGGHGTVNLYQAIEQSCDTYFYRLGHLVGIDVLAYYSKLFGLGDISNISLTNEKPGLVPTKEWKVRTFKAAWQEGETLSCAIGQSFALVTPMQMLVLISAIANGGEVVLPRVVKRVVNCGGEVIKEFRPTPRSRVPISPQTIRIIQESLRRVVQSPTGTGKIARIDGFELAGKTGTAQVVSLPADRKAQLPPEWRDHAWFVAYGPFEYPKIAVVVLVEHGGFGSTTAGPIARDVINFYFHRNVL